MCSAISLGPCDNWSQTCDLDLEILVAFPLLHAFRWGVPVLHRKHKYRSPLLLGDLEDVC